MRRFRVVEVSMESQSSRHAEVDDVAPWTVEWHFADDYDRYVAMRYVQPKLP